MNMQRYHVGPLRPFADELAPRPHLRRDASLCVSPQTALGYLLCETLYKELCTTGVIEKWQTKVDSVPIRRVSALSLGRYHIPMKDSPPSNVILVDGVLSTSLREVDDTFDLVVIEYLPKFSLVLRREEDTLRRDVRDVIQELLHDGRGAVKLEAKVDEAFCDGPHLRLIDVSANEDAATRARKLEASRTLERSPERLVDVLAKARDLSG